MGFEIGLSVMMRRMFVLVFSFIRWFLYITIIQWNGNNSTTPLWHYVTFISGMNGSWGRCGAVFLFFWNVACTPLFTSFTDRIKWFASHDHNPLFFLTWCLFIVHGRYIKYRIERHFWQQPSPSSLLRPQWLLGGPIPLPLVLSWFHLPKHCLFMSGSWLLQHMLDALYQSRLLLVELLSPREQHPKCRWQSERIVLGQHHCSGGFVIP